MGPSPKITYSISWFPEQVGQSFKRKSRGLSVPTLKLHYIMTLSDIQQDKLLLFTGRKKGLKQTAVGFLDEVFRIDGELPQELR